MKQQYDRKEITQMLSKFMAGETSVAEEQMLAQYFRTHEVGEEWTEYKEMFALFDSGEVDIALETDTSEQLNVGDGGKIRMLPKAVKEKPKIATLRWVSTAAACALLLTGLLTIKKNGEPFTEKPQIAQVGGTVEVKSTVVTPPVTNEKTLAQASPQKRNRRRKHSNVAKPRKGTLAQASPQKRNRRKKRSNVAKPHEENVRYMTDEMVDQLLARNRQASIQQPAANCQEAENEIKRRGELLTNDLLAFTTNN